VFLPLCVFPFGSYFLWSYARSVIPVALVDGARIEGARIDGASELPDQAGQPRRSGDGAGGRGTVVSKRMTTPNQSSTAGRKERG